VTVGLLPGVTDQSDPHVRSPLLNLNRACQTCHNAAEEEIKARAWSIDLALLGQLALGDAGFRAAGPWPGSRTAVSLSLQQPAKRPGVLPAP
jgi:hypothetical protein